MKIVGNDGKTYDSVEACLQAEKELEAAQARKEQEEAEKKSAISARKKELATCVKEAEDKLAAAQTDLEEAREAARKIVEEAQAKAKDIVRVAADAYKEASTARYQAIREFNKEFGTYTTTYTGQKALEEYRRTLNHFDDLFNNIFKVWF